MRGSMRLKPKSPPTKRTGPRPPNPHANDKCLYCGKKGHLVNRCFMKQKHETEACASKAKAKDTSANHVQGEFENENDENDTLSVETRAANQATKSEGRRLDQEREWVRDSGATHHMCYSKCVFATLDMSKPSSVRLSNGASTVVGGVGTVILTVKCSVSSLKVPIKLGNVLYIPNFDRNLVSVPKASQAGIGINFDQPGIMILFKSGHECFFPLCQTRCRYMLRYIEPPQVLQAAMRS
ncbi:Aste57867_3063 [Aphanomyces stellatus]|uniref:Aste57867_3063 protein n=1 Tax=Aphanomyces stellatus TaxID=120398 RepID=A0A485K8Y2_9STRA|nr:hypothetical protein As57867_003054 [Aphanomyces stellatus]VFT80243.1 Aste57867_3063 [Aphanomyces stellatus]